MTNEITRVIGTTLLLLAGATGWQAINCIFRFGLGDVVLGAMAGGLAYWLVKIAWRLMA